nr:DUF2285 domain-containing protein [Rhizobium sp. P44RR-XXIV]
MESAGSLACRHSDEGVHTVHPGDGAMQLLFLADKVENKPLAALIPLDTDILGRLEALSRFWRALQGGSMPQDTRMTVQQRRRLRLMMRAADGRANGASYRDIAIALYGRERVASDPWKTSALRDAAIGLVEGGLALIGGGYLKLLRHRRRA